MGETRRCYRITFTLIVLIILFTFSGAAIAEESVQRPPSFYRQLTSGIFRLESDVYRNIEGTLKRFHVPAGTGFFVLYENDLFVVTARHVVKPPNLPGRQNLTARVTVKNKTTGKDEIITLNLPFNGWIFDNFQGDEKNHPVDVAVIKLSQDSKIIDYSNEWLLYWIEHKPKESKKIRFATSDVEPPVKIIVFGFPRGVGFTLKSQTPFARSGVVSMCAEEAFIQIDGKYLDPDACLIDTEIFGGNSGSPVFNEKFHLVGIAVAGNEGMDYGIMEPVSKIVNILKIAKDKPARDHQFWKSLQKGP